MLQLDSLSVPNYLVARKSWHHVPCIAPDEETNRRWWPPKELMWWPDCWAPVIQSGAGPAAVPIGRLFCGAGAPSFCARPTIHGLATAQHAALWGSTHASKSRLVPRLLDIDTRPASRPSCWRARPPILFCLLPLRCIGAFVNVSTLDQHIKLDSRPHCIALYRPCAVIMEPPQLHSVGNPYLSVCG